MAAASMCVKVVYCSVLLPGEKSIDVGFPDLAEAFSRRLIECLDQ